MISAAWNASSGLLVGSKQEPMAKRGKKGIDPTIAALIVGTALVFIALLIVTLGDDDEVLLPDDVNGVEDIAN